MLKREFSEGRKKQIKRVLLARRYKATGPAPDVVELVLERAQYACELKGCMVGDRRGVDWSVHHRLPRRMGGTSRPEVNLPPSLIVLCGSGTTGCHGWLEARRTEAYDMGLLLHAGDDPAAVPVELAVGLVYLTADGRYADEPPEGESADTAPEAGDRPDAVAELLDVMHAEQRRLLFPDDPPEVT